MAFPRQPNVLPKWPSRAELEDAAQWLRARVPALYGPDSDREWVRVLRRLVSYSVA